MSEDQRPAGHSDEEDWATDPVTAKKTLKRTPDKVFGVHKDWMMIQGPKTVELMPMEEWKNHYAGNCFCGASMVGLWLVHKEVRN